MALAKFYEDLTNDQCECLSKVYKKYFYIEDKYDDTKENSNIHKKNRVKKLKEQIFKLNIWINFDRQHLKSFHSKILTKYLKNQINWFEYIQNDYYDQLYSPGLSDFRNTVNIDKKAIKQESIKIKKDFLKYLLKLASEMRNRNIPERLYLEAIFLDIKNYLTNNYDLNKSTFKKIPLKFLREELLRQTNFNTVNCHRCNKQTYDDFGVCIFCYNDMGSDD